jgi:hypothetical protein
VFNAITEGENKNMATDPVRSMFQYVLYVVLKFVGEETFQSEMKSNVVNRQLNKRVYI